MNKVDKECLMANLQSAMQSLADVQSMVRAVIWQLEEMEKKETDEKTE